MTKKELQIMENAEVLDSYSKFKYLLDTGAEFTQGCETRLYTCNATVYETNSYIILKSYNTIVAYIEKDSRNLYDILRYVYGYTATSSQHIGKFAKKYRSHFTQKWTYKEV